MKKLDNCVDFILVKGNNFLVEKRTKSKQLGPGMTAIPGGHVLERETIEHALKREIKEELGITPKEYNFLCKIVSPHKKEKNIVHYFIITKWHGTPKAKEAEKITWLDFTKYDKLDIPADKKAIKRLLQI